jgi:prepilin-type N-terminal cleavage/methylation domain-containing protein
MEPAMPVVPQVINENNSLLVNLVRYGLMMSGVSLIPVNMLAETLRPSVPPTFKVLRKNKENILIMKFKGNIGFTLIELLVVVAIIGILAAAGIVSYNNFTSAAKVNVVKNNFNELTNFIKITYAKCDAGQKVILNDQKLRQ